MQRRRFSSNTNFVSSSREKQIKSKLIFEKHNGNSTKNKRGKRNRKAEEFIIYVWDIKYEI